jgi:hypothetical protein
MAYTTGTATSNLNLIDQIIRYVCGYGTTGSITQTGTGNGTLTLGGTYPSAGTFPATISETWTLTCTAAATNSGTFSVVGSVSGAQASATVGVAYANSFVAFTIADGSVDFVVGDAFTFTTTQGAMKAASIEWDYLGRASGQTTGGWIRGKGLTGSESIYVGMQTADTPASDVYNIEISGSLGFNSASAFSSQAGKSPVSYMCAWNTTTPFWLVANGQRFVVVAKVSTTYHAMYCGKILPYGTPSQYGYPVFIAGETNTATLRWSSTNIEFRHFSDPGGDQTTNSGANLCHPDGTWYGYFNFYNSAGTDANSNIGRSVWPYAGDATDSSGVQSFLRELRENVDGSYSLFPLILNTDTPGRQVFGEMDGCYYVSGHNNAAENVVTIGGVDHLVVQNIFRTARYNYWALKLQ